MVDKLKNKERKGRIPKKPDSKIRNFTFLALGGSTFPERNTVGGFPFPENDLLAKVKHNQNITFAREKSPLPFWAYLLIGVGVTIVLGNLLLIGIICC